MTRLSRHRYLGQSGQAMVEFVVAALFFLVPLFLAIVVLGKFSDVQHTTQMAGRYGAWERTVWYDDSGTSFDTMNSSNQKSAAEIAREIGVRVINDRSRADSVIADTDRAATSFANGIDPMWHDNANTAYLSRFEQQQLSVERASLPADVTGAAVSALGTLSIPGVTGSLAPPVPRETFVVARIDFREVAKDSRAYQMLWPRASVWSEQWNGVDFGATSAILSNTWYANGSQATTEMVQSSVPFAQAAPRVAAETALLGLRAWDARTWEAEFGKVAPDVVPGDRLR